MFLIFMNIRKNGGINKPAECSKKEIARKMC